MSLSLLSSDYLSDLTKQRLIHLLTSKMALSAKTRDKLRKELVTKIHGQPMDHDITTLKKELVSITASIPSGLGGGNH